MSATVQLELLIARMPSGRGVLLPRVLAELRADVARPLDLAPES
jgi:hypothetical protein